MANKFSNSIGLIETTRGTFATCRSVTVTEMFLERLNGERICVTPHTSEKLSLANADRLFLYFLVMDIIDVVK